MADTWVGDIRHDKWISLAPKGSIWMVWGGVHSYAVHSGAEIIPWCVKKPWPVVMSFLSPLLVVVLLQRMTGGKILCASMCTFMHVVIRMISVLCDCSPSQYRDGHGLRCRWRYTIRFYSKWGNRQPDERISSSSSLLIWRVELCVQLWVWLSRCW